MVFEGILGFVPTAYEIFTFLTNSVYTNMIKL